MSSEAYEEGRLHRENMSEEIARAFHFAAAKSGVTNGLTPLASWEDLDPKIRKSIQEAVLDIIDQGIIAPFAVVNNLQIQLTEIKQTWGKFNDLLGTS